MARAGKVDELIEFLGWEEMPAELEEGFLPQKNAKELSRMIKDNQKRHLLKEKRIKAGFHDLLVPRKGIKGFIQKKFRDPKEIELPLGYDLFVWTRDSPRLGLLTTLHDSLLGFCSSAEPRKVEVEEVTEQMNPLARMLIKNQEELLEELQKALTLNLKQVDPSFIIKYCPGYVVHYDSHKGIAYYFGEPY